MTTRKYSLAELDQMRAMIRERNKFALSNNLEVRYAVEDELRTLMLNGTEPAELLAEKVARDEAIARELQEEKDHLHAATRGVNCQCGCAERTNIHLSYKWVSHEWRNQPLNNRIVIHFKCGGIVETVSNDARKSLDEIVYRGCPKAPPPLPLPEPKITGEDNALVPLKKKGWFR